MASEALRQRQGRPLAEGRVQSGEGLGAWASGAQAPGFTVQSRI